MLPKELMKKLEKNLSGKRYYHSLGVAYVSASLAMCHHADVDKAFTAGLLHDCSKELSEKETFAYCEKHGIPLSEKERLNPAVLHGLTGYYYASEEYGISDEEILTAIRYHVSGCPKMTLLQMIVFIADYIEPGRKLSGEGYDRIREEAFKNPEKACYLISEAVLNHLTETKAVIVDDIIHTRDYYKEQAIG